MNRIRRWKSPAVTVGTALVTVFGASIVSFVLLRLVPGDPARMLAGAFATPAQLAVYRKSLGLDRPVLVQYWNYVSSFVRGDWGYSYSTGQPVRTILLNRLPASIELGAAAFVLALVFAVLVAWLSSYRRRPVLDRLVSGTGIMGVGTPVFWLGLVLILIFSRSLHWLPTPNGQLGRSAPPTHLTGFVLFDSLVTGRFDLFFRALGYLLLPAVALGFAPFGVLVRLLRSSLQQVASEPYLVVGRSKGLTRRRNYLRNALANAISPTLTVAGLIFAQLVAGSILVEVVFDWPGAGQLVVNSVQQKDFAVVQSFVILSAVLFVVVNSAVDLLQSRIDPRLRAAAPGMVSAQ